MRRVRRNAGRAELERYQEIIEVYAPYVLIRCAAFTNSRRLSQEIGTYVLICTCLMLRKLDHSGQLGILIEVMLETVGPDVASRGEGVGDEPLFVDRRMRVLVGSLNRLERPFREALVLTSVGGRAARELARLTRKPTAEIEASVACAKDALAEELGVHGVAGVEARLVGLVATFDFEWTLEVECAAMAYLMSEVAPVDRLPRYWLN